MAKDVVVLGVAFAFLILAYAVLGVLAWLHRRKLRFAQQALKRDEQELQRYRAWIDKDCRRAEAEVAKADAKLAQAKKAIILASEAVQATIEYVTAGMPEGLVREELRDELHSLAFNSPELFRSRLGASQSTRTAPRQTVPTVPEMPIPLEAFHGFAGVSVNELRARVRHLRNAGIIPRHVVSGAQVSRLNQRQSIALLLRFDPASVTQAAA